ncbi:MAG: methyltransferase domain-containing protein [Pseudomonadota bacterium]
MDDEAFADAARIGLSETARVDASMRLFAPVSGQLIAPLIDAVGAGRDQAVLDLCCGHGSVTAALFEGGAKVTGLDFSPAMLDQARPRV